MPSHPPEASNRNFLFSLATSLLFLTISAAVLIAGFITWHHPNVLDKQPPSPITIAGKDLRIDIGKGKYQGDSLVLTALEDTHSVLSAPRITFEASNYPIIKYEIEGRHPGIKVAFYWRTTIHNQKTQFAELHWNGDIPTAYRLEAKDSWSDTVTEFGISITGDIRNQPITIKYIALSPPSVGNLLLTVWSEWNAFSSWSHSSINAVRGSVKNPIISSVVAGAIWAGLAVLLYILWIVFRTLQIRIQRKQRIPIKNKFALVIASIFLISWLALDMKWQVHLWRQLEETIRLFSGKSLMQKHLAADDRVLFKFATQVKKKLPDTPQRIIIVSSLNRYFRLRLLYHLLPHNVYAFPLAPTELLAKLKTNDYVLILGTYKQINFDNNQGHLQYNSSNSIPATLIFEALPGSVYKIGTSK